MFKHLLLSTISIAAIANPAFAQLNPAEFKSATPMSQPGERISPYARSEFTPSASAAAASPAATTAPTTNAWLDAPANPGPAAPSSAANYTVNQTQTTSTQGASSPNGPNLPTAKMSTLDKMYGGSLSLPPTVLDSFVQNAGGQAFQIYGDEGTNGPPPLNNFNYINDGIKSGGLTTGHKSGLPSSWDYPQ